MKSAKEIETEFKSKASVRGGLLLFHPADAIAIVSRCRSEKLRILGIDGFLITENTTQPLMESSVDFSSKSRTKLTEDNWQEAEEFLRQRESSGLVFEIVIE